LGSSGEVEVLKIERSQLERVRELYKKAVHEAKTSETQFSTAVEKAGSKTNEKIAGTAGAQDKAPVSSAQYDDLLARVDSQTEELAVQTVARAPDIREARVQAIAEAIKNKTYKIDAEAVAERMLASGIFDDNE
jgi:flagellar biosynthesis anti-sigma factor FlgM